MYCQNCKVTCSRRHVKLTNVLCTECPETCQECFYWEFRGEQEVMTKEKDFTICKRCKVECDLGVYGSCTKCPEDCLQCITYIDAFNEESIVHECNQEHCNDHSKPDPPDLTKVKRRKVQKQINRFTFMYSAYALKLKAVIMRLGQTKKLEPKCTHEDCLDFSHKILKYKQQYQKENFLCASKHTIYWMKRKTEWMKEEFDECCDCHKLYPTSFQNVKRHTVNYVQDLGDIWEDFLTVHKYAKEHGFKIEVPITLKDIHRKLYDESLSQKDLNAILNCILFDNEGKKTDKTIIKGLLMNIVKSPKDLRKNGRWKKEKMLNPLKNLEKADYHALYCNPPEPTGTRKIKIKKGNTLRNLLRSTQMDKQLA